MDNTIPKKIAVIGGGPAGLMAAEVLAEAGAAVTVFERMPSVGRKFLMAGRGGLNLTHSEPFAPFMARYGAAADWLRPALEAFPPTSVDAWTKSLGQDTFVGSSGRIFPKVMKASPLLRSWLVRLARLGVEIRTRWDWQGWDGTGALSFRQPGGTLQSFTPDATILALGGASWPRLGATGAWATLLAGRGVRIAPLRAANSGLLIDWSDLFRDRFAGTPLKTIGIEALGETSRGEAMVTRSGLEGGAVYALSAAISKAVQPGPVSIAIDLRPGDSIERLATQLGKARKGESLSTRLRKRLSLAPVAANLLREQRRGPLSPDPMELAAAVKRVELTVTGTASIERAISTAGGIGLDEMDGRLMLKRLPGVFLAGEMLDWDAPTGGYLLTACLATGHASAKGVLDWMEHGGT